MPTPAKLTPDQWARIRAVWENDPREGYSWIVEHLELKIVRSSVRRKALEEGWKKRIKNNKNNDIQDIDQNAETPVKAAQETSAKSHKRKGKKAVTHSEIKPQKPKQNAGKKRSKIKAKSGIAANDGNDSDSKIDSNESDKNGGGSDAINSHDKHNLSGDSREIDVVRPAFGRPPEFKNEYIFQAHKLCLLGLTDAQLADFFEISVRTLQYWKQRYPDFLHSIKAAKTVANAEVAASLYQRAVGMPIRRQVLTTYKGKVSITEVQDYIPPDVTAQRIWLYNREPQLWRAEPQPPEQDLLSTMPTEDEMDALYAQSQEVSARRSKERQERNERLGIVPNSTEIAADAELMPVRKVKTRASEKDVIDMDDSEGAGNG